MEVSVRELRLSSEPDSSYFLRVDWRGRSLGSGFRLLLTDGQSAWRGDVSEAEVREEAEELEMQTERYVQDLRQALTEAETSGTYSFALTPPPPDRREAVTLQYEKVQKDISFRLGSARLTADPQPAEAVRRLLIHSLQRGTRLEKHNQSLQEEKQRLTQEQRRIAADLERYAAGKEALEAELYSRFVLVLNEKKAKIRSLLKETSSGGQKEEQQEEEEEEEEDEYGGSTDEEPEEAESTSSPRRRGAASPLDGGLRDLPDVAPSRKRRLRHLGPPEAEPQGAQRKRADPPQASSKQQTPPQRPSEAVTSAAEDLFEDF
ncbi:DNA repair protein XRCC4-like [Pungitius pungitius]|uniref:DNA repair protein XRCC4-like n=1 Tax=Pungitius pungitius TaxID=134920 RepID=UPI002E14EF55